MKRYSRKDSKTLKHSKNLLVFMNPRGGAGGGARPPLGGQLPPLAP